MEVAGLLVGIVGIVLAVPGLVYSYRAANGVAKLRETLSAQVHHERVTGRLKLHCRNISNMLEARTGGMALRNEVAQALAQVEDLAQLLTTTHRNEVEGLMRMMRNPASELRGWATEILARSSKLAETADNVLNKRTLSNSGV